MSKKLCEELKNVADFCIKNKLTSISSWICHIIAKYDLNEEDRLKHMSTEILAEELNGRLFEQIKNNLHNKINETEKTIFKSENQHTIILPSDKEGLIESKEDNIPIANSCPVCNGAGHFPRNEDDAFSLPEECEACGGSGVKI